MTSPRIDRLLADTRQRLAAISESAGLDVQTLLAQVFGTIA